MRSFAEWPAQQHYHACYLTSLQCGPRHSEKQLCAICESLSGPVPYGELSTASGSFRCVEGAAEFAVASLTFDCPHSEKLMSVLSPLSGSSLAASPLFSSSPLMQWCFTISARRYSRMELSRLCVDLCCHCCSDARYAVDICKTSQRFIRSDAVTRCGMVNGHASQHQIP